MGGGGYDPPKDVCWATEQRFRLAPPFITIGVENLVREVRFESCDNAYMNAGTSSLLFSVAQSRRYGAVAIQSVAAVKYFEGKHLTLDGGVGAASM